MLRSPIDYRLVFIVLFPFAGAGCPCSDNVNGVHNGDRIQTTIVGPYTAAGPYTAVAHSCGDLGDLVPGAVLTSTATLQGASDSCYFEVDITPQSLSTGTVTQDRYKNSIVTLPGGCSGTLRVSFQPGNGSAEVLDNSLDDAGNPQWWLDRQFAPLPDAGACPDAAQTLCADDFLAHDVRVAP